MMPVEEDQSQDGDGIKDYASLATQCLTWLLAQIDGEAREKKEVEEKSQNGAPRRLNPGEDWEQ